MTNQSTQSHNPHTKKCTWAGHTTTPNHTLPPPQGFTTLLCIPPPLQAPMHAHGKDAPLDLAIAHMQHTLAQTGFSLHPSSRLNPTPGIHSLHLQARACPHLYTNGKGDTEQAALASGLGEFIERLACNYFWADYHLLGTALDANAPFFHYPNEKRVHRNATDLEKHILTPDLREYYQPPIPALLDRSFGFELDTIFTIPMQRQSDGAIVAFPLALLNELYASNGMASGNSQSEARVQALSEVCERAVKFKVIAEGLALPPIPRHHLAGHHAVIAAWDAIEARGLHCQVRDASLGGRYPVVNVTLINPRHGTCLASFGAHPSFAVALERTFTELLQGRTLDKLDDLHRPTPYLDEVDDPHNLENHFIDANGLVALNYFREQYDFSPTPWDYRGENGQWEAALIALLQEEGHDVYIADQPLAGHYACRVVVPRLSEIYPIDDLEYAGEGNLLRQRLATLNLSDPKAITSFNRHLHKADFADHQNVAEILGLLPDPQSPEEQLTIGELKLRTALTMGDRQEALEWAEWACAHKEENLDFQLLRSYLHLTNEEQSIKHYRPGLVPLFGEERLHKVETMVEKQHGFADLHIFQPFSTSHSHNTLAEAYRTLHQARTRWEEPAPTNP